MSETVEHNICVLPEIKSNSQCVCECCETFGSTLRPPLHGAWLQGKPSTILGRKLLSLWFRMITPSRWTGFWWVLVALLWKKNQGAFWNHKWIERKDFAWSTFSKLPLWSANTLTSFHIIFSHNLSVQIKLFEEFKMKIRWKPCANW